MTSSRRVAALVVLALFTLAAGAVATALGGSTRSAQITTIKASEKDFAISLPKVVTAGTFDIRVTNRGPDQHELIAVRKSGQRLPLRHDGLTVDEDALEKATVAGLEPGPLGVRSLRVKLRPGRYIFFCNMSGHFMSGMHAVLVVK